MAFCENCGKELAEGQVCDCALLDSEVGLWAKMKNRMGIGDPERNDLDKYERGMKIVPECIRANEKEIPVKQYNIAILRNILKFERAEGRMQITNKRLIFRAAGSSVRGRTTLQNEFAIDEIAGIETRQNYKFSFLFLIFGILIVIFANLIISGSPPSLSSYKSTGILYGNRIYSMMNPSHIEKHRENERFAIGKRIALEEKIPKVEIELEKAQTSEIKAEKDTVNGILKISKVATGKNWWGEVVYENRQYRDKSPEGLAEAKEKLKIATTNRIDAEKNLQKIIDDKNLATKEEQLSIEKRKSSENFWTAFLVILGIILGIGGLLPFFLLYKKFGIKLFILNFSIFGFALSLIVSGSVLFNLLLFISIFVTLFCIFIYCFRPNLVIEIKNKSGFSAAIDVRRDTNLTAYTTEKGLGFGECIPTEETDGAIREIGAIIGDIQKFGDFGIEKWIEK